MSAILGFELPGDLSFPPEVPPEVREEVAACARQIQQTQTPLRYSHVLLGRRLESSGFPAGENRVAFFTTPYSPGFISPLKRFPETVISLGPFATLTRRELQVMISTGHGCDSQETADALGMSRRTAETHRYAIGQKTGLTTQTAIAIAVRSAGLVMRDAELRRV